MKDEDIERLPLLESKKAKSQDPSFKALLQFANRYDFLIFSIGILATTISAISPAVQIYQTGEILEDIEEDYNNKEEFYESERTLAFTNYVLGVVTIIVGTISVVSFIKIRTRQGLFWRQAYFSALTRKPIEWFDKRNPAELGTSIDRDCNTIELGTGEKAMVFLSGIIFFIFSWILCFYLSIEITLVLLLKLPISLLCHYIAQKSSESIIKEKKELYQTAGAIAEECLEGIKTVASCNAQHMIAKRYQTELEPLKNSGTLMGIINGIAWGVLFSQFSFFIGLGFYIGAILIDEGDETWTGTDLTAGSLFVTCFVSGTASFSLSMSMPCLEYIFSSRIAAAALSPRIQKTKTKYDGYTKPLSIKGSISFEKVYFNYPSNPEVEILQGVSLQVEAGDSLAIVGETGSGKSTIIQLIEGFYYCSSGSVKIDGVDIKEYDLSALREFISLVSQEPVLFNCSIEENIRMGKEDASTQEIEEAATEAGASDFIENLPGRYKTWVGVKGTLISGGQKQRIALARAMIRKPKILLMDEATSALDMNTEDEVRNNIERAMVGTTVVIVAQRMSSIKKAKHIVVLDQGKVVESGTYEYLIEKDGHFKRILGVQKEGDRKIELKTASLDENVQGIHKKQDLKKADKISKDARLTAVARVIKLLRNHWPWLTITCISAIIGGGTVPIFSYFVAKNNNALIDPSEDSMLSEVQKNFFFITGASILVLVALIIMCATLSRISQLITYELRYKSLNSLLHYDQKFYDRPKSAPALLSERLSNDCEKVASLGGPLLSLLLFVLTGMIGGFILGIIHDARLAALTIAFLPFLYLVSGHGERFVTKGIIANLEKTSIIASDTFTNIKTVKSFNRQEYFYSRYIASAVIENANVMRLSYVSGFFYGCRYFMMYLIWGSVAWYGAYRVKKDTLSIEDMMITYFCVIFTSIGFIVVAFLSPDIEGGVKGGKHLFKTIDYVPEINANSQEGSFDLINGSIEFKDVEFSYEGRESIVLRSVSFAVRSGGRLGITGTTGSGKSTIGQLLLRFYDPTGGAIYLDSVPLKEYNIRHLRDAICWVGQEPMLFRGSILYNLQVARIDITAEEAIEVLAKAQAMDIVEKYGIDSDVGFRGGRLSGGQKQRIAIARALARGPKVLVLDESTSALDPVTEMNLMKSIKDEKMTVVSIAHRIRSIRDYEQILLIERGTVVEFGNHEELMAIENGFYRELFNKS